MNQNFLQQKMWELETLIVLIAFFKDLHFILINTNFHLSQEFFPSMFIQQCSI